MNKEEKEAIIYLNKYIKSDLFYEQEHYNRIKIVLNYIDKLQKENEELKEELEKYEQLVGFTTIRIKPEDIKVVTDKFISKDIIRNKIKELKNTYSEHSEFRIGKIIEILEELIGE